MKYQQLENLESGWKWHYLVKRYQEGEAITRYIEKSAAEDAIKALLLMEDNPTNVVKWIAENLNPELANRLKQSIRARRKRHFNAEQQSMRKKSIDLEFAAWQRLANLAQRRKTTLSETVIQLINDAEQKDQYVTKVSTIKDDLLSLLDNKH